MGRYGYSGMGSGMYSGGYSGSYYSGGLGSSSYGYGFGGPMGTTPARFGQQNGSMAQNGTSTFRSEYQALFSGLFSTLSIMYAGVGMVSFGGMFFRMGARVLGFMLRGSWKVLRTVLGITLLKKIVRLLLDRNPEKPAGLLRNLNQAAANSNPKFRKALILVQIVSVFGLAFILFLRFDLKKRRRARGSMAPKKGKREAQRNEDEPSETKPKMEEEEKLNEKEEKEVTSDQNKEEGPIESPKWEKERNDETDFGFKDNSFNFERNPWIEAVFDQKPENPDRKEGVSSSLPLEPTGNTFENEPIVGRANSMTFESFYYNSEQGRPSPWSMTKGEKAEENKERVVGDWEVPKTQKDEESASGSKPEKELIRTESLNTFRPVLWNKKMPWLKHKSAETHSEQNTEEKEAEP